MVRADMAINKVVLKCELGFQTTCNVDFAHEINIKITALFGLSDGRFAGKAHAT